MELEDIKQQWETITQKLNEQQIINRRLMQNIVGRKIDFINSYNWANTLVFLILLPVVTAIGIQKNIPSTVLWLTIIILAIGLLSSIYHALLFNKTKSFRNNIVESETNVTKYQQFSYWYYLISIIIVALFLIYFYFDFNDIMVKYNRVGIFITICFAGIVLAIVEMKWYIGKINNLRQSISDLKEFEKE